MITYNALEQYQRDVIKNNLRRLLMGHTVEYENKSTKNSIKVIGFEQGMTCFELDIIGKSKSFEMALKDFRVLKEIKAKEIILRTLSEPKAGDTSIGGFYNDLYVIYRLAEDGTYTLYSNITVLKNGVFHYNYNMGESVE